MPRPQARKAKRFGRKESRSLPAHQHSITSPALVRALLAWFCRNARDLPWRRTRDPYAIWVSEIMLQQTQVKTVIPYWERWMRELPAVEALAEASSARIHKLWEGLGYYTRVRNMQKAAQVIVQCRGGEFPSRHEEVLALPGIGRYTAGAICSIAFNQPTPIVDGNVIRVLARLFAIAGDPKDKAVHPRFWEIAEVLVRTAAKMKTREVPACSFLNQSLMELGALICTPRDPKCSACPVRDQCAAHRDDRVAEFPALPRRAEPTLRNFVACIVNDKGRYLVRQRPADVVNAHLWEFPNYEISPRRGLLSESIAPFRIGNGAKPICEFTHSITRYRNRLRAFPAELSMTPASGELGVWLSIEQLQALAFSSAHKRILRHLIEAS